MQLIADAIHYPGFIGFLVSWLTILLILPQTDVVPWLRLPSVVLIVSGMLVMFAEMLGVVGRF